MSRVRAALCSSTDVVMVVRTRELKRRTVTRICTQRRETADDEGGGRPQTWGWEDEW